MPHRTNERVRSRKFGEFIRRGDLYTKTPHTYSDKHLLLRSKRRGQEIAHVRAGVHCKEVLGKELSIPVSHVDYAIRDLGAITHEPITVTHTHYRRLAVPSDADNLFARDYRAKRIGFRVVSWDGCTYTFQGRAKIESV